MFDNVYLAASSPTHSVPAEVYHEGWARKRKNKRHRILRGYTLQLRHQGNPPHGGPLFWAHIPILVLIPEV